MKIRLNLLILDEILQQNYYTPKHPVEVSSYFLFNEVGFPLLKDLLFFSGITRVIYVFGAISI